MKPEQVQKIAEAAGTLSAGTWIAIVTLGFIVLAVLVILNFDKISKLLFGDKKGILNSSTDCEIENPIIHYISGWYETIKLADALKLSSLENLLEFLKTTIANLDLKKVSDKKLTIDLSQTEKINSTAIKDITSFIEICITDYPQIELVIIVSSDASEQMALSENIWLALINSFKIGGRNDINVNVIRQ